MENHTSTATQAEVETIVRDPEGKQVATQRTPIDVHAHGSAPGRTQFAVATPKFWDVDSPQRYTATTRLLADGRLPDTTETPFGIRTFKFTADDGFHLNGRRVQVKGANLHSDLGPLGMVVNLRAAQRQLETMKGMGVTHVNGTMITTRFAEFGRAPFSRRAGFLLVHTARLGTIRERMEIPKNPRLFVSLSY